MNKLADLRTKDHIHQGHKCQWPFFLRTPRNTAIDDYGLKPQLPNGSILAALVLTRVRIPTFFAHLGIADARTDSTRIGIPSGRVIRIPQIRRSIRCDRQSLGRRRFKRSAGYFSPALFLPVVLSSIQPLASSPQPPEPGSAGGAIVGSPARSGAECRDTMNENCKVPEGRLNVLWSSLGDGLRNLAPSVSLRSCRANLRVGQREQ